MHLGGSKPQIGVAPAGQRRTVEAVAASCQGVNVQHTAIAEGVEADAGVEVGAVTEAGVEAGAELEIGAEVEAGAVAGVGAEVEVGAEVGVDAEGEADGAVVKVDVG